ncbi:16S rRNA (cytosine(1402)-N(4))-methyltransferase [Shigella flexneri]
MMENYKHTTVLLDEAVNGLNIRPDGIYIDEPLVAVVTRALSCRSLASRGRLIAIDRDSRSDRGGENHP